MPKNPDNTTPIRIQRALERIRQERETFDQRKKHEILWFNLRLIMGYTAVILLTAILVISSIIIFYHTHFPDSVVTSAGVALFVDVLGLIVTVWKVVLNPEFTTRLDPVTEIQNDNDDE